MAAWRCIALLMSRLRSCSLIKLMMTWPLHSDCPRLPLGWHSPGGVTSSQVSRCLSSAPVARLDRLQCKLQSCLAQAALSRPHGTRLLAPARSHKAQTLLSTSRATMWTRSVNALQLRVKVPCTSSSTLCGAYLRKLQFECWLLREG